MLQYGSYTYKYFKISQDVKFSNSILQTVNLLPLFLLLILYLI